MRVGLPCLSISMSSGPRGKPRCGPDSGLLEPKCSARPCGVGVRLDRLRVRGFETEAARAIDRADQHLQQMQRTRCLEPVGMRRNTAHRMKGHGPPDKAIMRLAIHVRPWLVDDDGFVESDAGDFGGKATDHVNRDARLGGNSFGRILRVEIFRRPAVRRPGPRSACRPARFGRKVPRARHVFPQVQRAP